MSTLLYSHPTPAQRLGMAAVPAWIDRLARIKPPSGTGTALTGQAAWITQFGGRFKRTRCDCSAPKTYDPSDGTYSKACDKGSSCAHTVGILIRRLKLAGWTYEDAALLALSPDAIGFTWLACQDDPDALFERWWDAAYAAPEPAPEQPADSAPPKAKRRRWRWQYGAFTRLLAWVKARQGANRNSLVATFAAATGWPHGTVHKYLQECVRRGYLTYTVSGGRRERAYTVIGAPAKPARRLLADRRHPGYYRLSHFTSTQLTHVTADVALTPEQFMALYGDDIAWQVAMEARARRRRMRAAARAAAQSLAPPPPLTTSPIVAAMA